MNQAVKNEITEIDEKDKSSVGFERGLVIIYLSVWYYLSAFSYKFGRFAFYKIPIYFMYLDFSSLLSYGFQIITLAVLITFFIEFFVLKIIDKSQTIFENEIRIGFTIWKYAGWFLFAFVVIVVFIWGVTFAATKTKYIEPSNIFSIVIVVIAVFSLFAVFRLKLKTKNNNDQLQVDLVLIRKSISELFILTSLTWAFLFLTYNFHVRIYFGIFILLCFIEFVLPVFLFPNQNFSYYKKYNEFKYLEKKNEGEFLTKLKIWFKKNIGKTYFYEFLMLCISAGLLFLYSQYLVKNENQHTIIDINPNTKMLVIDVRSNEMICKPFNENCRTFDKTFIILKESDYHDLHIHEEETGPFSCPVSDLSPSSPSSQKLNPPVSSSSNSSPNKCTKGSGKRNIKTEREG